MAEICIDLHLPDDGEEASALIEAAERLYPSISHSAWESPLTLRNFSTPRLVRMLIGGEGVYGTKGTHNLKDDSTTAH
jgi:hypothetical protein